jgi:hypothetical protein
MIINKIYDNIYEIENFITDEECQEILEIAYLSKEEDWHVDKDEYNTSEFWSDKSLYLYTNPPEVINNINDRVSTFFKSFDHITKINAIHRFSKDVAMGRHKDNYTKMGNISSAYGVVLYYNDNYLGGEIEYPDLNIKLKPKAKSLIIHAGDILHGTTSVQSDSIRYFSTSFIREKDGTKVKLNPEIFGG